jgi:purine-binding chemotaxis protein CheW
VETVTVTPDLARQLVVFSLGEEEYALAITQVQEIIRYSEPRAVASETPWIRGVISLRGKIVPVCDLALRLGVPAQPPHEAKIVIVETDAGTIGVIVDEVQEVLTIPGEQLEDAPATSNEFIDAIAKVEDRLIILLDTDKLFQDIELGNRASG